MPTPPPKEPTPEPEPEVELEELMPPTDDFDPSLWEAAPDEIVAGEPKAVKFEEPVVAAPPPKPAEPPAKVMTEREKDLEWARARALMRPPLIVSHLKDRAGPVGSTVKLTCSVSGPELAVKWLKNGVQVDKIPAKYKFNVSEALLSLEISDLELSDAAEYTCLIRNKNGETSTVAHVKVYETYETRPVPPTFISIKGKNTFNFFRVQ